MIKDNQKMLNRIHVLLDVCVIVIAFLLTYYLRFYSPLANLPLLKAEKGTFYALDVYVRRSIILIPLFLFMYYYAKLYTPKRGKRKWLEIFHIILANTIVIAFFSATLYIQKEFHISRGFLGVFYITNIILCTTARMTVTYILRAARKRGYNLKHVLMVGYSRAAEAYIDRIFANPQWGYYIHGILDDSMEVGTIYKKVPVIGTISGLDAFLSKMTLDEITITISINEYEKLENIVAICEKSGVHTKFIPDYHNFIPTKPYTEDIYGLPVINIRNVPLSNTYNRLLKRSVDIFGALFALVLFSVPMLLVAFLIKLTSKGPIIFSQIRIGKNNKEFKMYKFRSMELQPENDEKKAWTTSGDPRVTGIGKFIRKTSIDELPQLFNVLKGDMSLVGPRPERPFFVEKFKEEIPRYMIKHQVSPGLTGWAQINGYRGDTSIRKRIDHDIYYIENWTLSLDIKILFLTIFKGFINKNAY
ncbi:undecaprenyl-phosphate glucose phosphotransferase [Mobilitalea sibirica]|uniref:Undecaprenyl-phosphate glucose phosphotransferase n=1 Tax=Mobilitalea sibirica TaxID=1462919 RepID=A0A8J7H1K8_9FIRM|nr:undecaprenyl-phosphate glucose phosphotransferase [Mobilitalea sibirica]MBH1940364.1 undecaprenyl-phosphate glucose phosphotransferase [Mobilitalea sibirica]